MEVVFSPGNSNTGASTINVAALGVKDIKDYSGAVLAAGVLTAGLLVTLIYVGASGHFRVLRSSFAWQVLNAATAAAFRAAIDAFSNTGTTTNDDAAAGKIGEYLTASSSGTALSNGVGANIASVSLTAGDWDVQGRATYTTTATTTVSRLSQGISTVSGTVGTEASAFRLPSGTTLNTPAGGSLIDITPVTRISLASTTTVYLVSNCSFGTSTMSADGSIRARRVR
jgi:hypothetical protein